MEKPKMPITCGFCWGDLWEGEDGLLHCSCKHWIATVEAGLSELPEAYTDYVDIPEAKTILKHRHPLTILKYHIANILMVLESVANTVRINESESNTKDWEWFDTSVDNLNEFLTDELQNPELSEIDDLHLNEMCRITERLREIIKSGDSDE